MSLKTSCEHRDTEQYFVVDQLWKLSNYEKDRGIKEKVTQRQEGGEIICYTVRFSGGRITLQLI